MSWGAAMLTSLVSALGRPAWWVLALASFLVRGGLALFILPIVILPTPAGLQNAFGAEITGFAFGSPSGSFISAVILLSLAVAAWLMGGGLLAAWMDVVLIGAVARERLARDVTRTAELAWRVVAIRLVSHLPVAGALSWGTVRIYEAVYGEYLHPGDLATPLFVRIALRIPDVIAVIGLAWMAGETAGGLGIRHLILGRRTTVVALARGWLDLVTRPSVAATLLLTSTVFVAVTLPTARAAADAWERLRMLLAGTADPRLVVAGLTAFAATWLAGLAAAGVVAAWRSSAWTLEAARREPAALATRAVAGEAVPPPKPARSPWPAASPAAEPGAIPRELAALPLESVAVRHAGGGEPV